MAVAAVLPVPVQQFFDNNGNPLSGGLLYSYQAGTSGLVPQGLYKDVALSIAYTNPIELDAAGRPSGPIYPLTSPAYDFVLKSASGEEIWPATNIIAVLGAS